jgi:hypothetical protein
MKFVSKNPNLRVVLEPGVPGDRLAGRIAKTGVYVKFEDGIAKVENEEMIKMMLNHPGFESDYICADDGSDPYAASRKSSEPDHSVAIMEHGRIGKNLNPKPNISFTSEQLEYIRGMIKTEAQKEAVTILKGLVAESKEKRVKNPAKKVVANKKVEETPNVEV